MSIMPSGRRKQQIAQGGSRNASIFETDMFNAVASKYAQSIKGQGEINQHNRVQPENTPKDLKMQELQQTMNESNTLPQEKESTPIGAGSEFIDISKRISEKVIDALGLNSRPGEHWAGKTEIANDGDEVTGITIKLTRAQPKDMMMQGRVEKNGPVYGEPMREDNSQVQPITNSV